MRILWPAAGGPVTDHAGYEQVLRDIGYLVEELGGTVVGINFVIELSFLGGREKLEQYDLHALITY